MTLARGQEDPRLDAARARPIAEVAAALGIEGLRPAGREQVGPCPVCGGHDRFSIAPDRGVFNCRQCGGGDVIGLVQLVQGVDFKAALSWLEGDRAAQIDPAEAARRKAARAEAAARRDAESARRRAQAQEQARKIWAEAIPATGTPVAHYLARRGIDLGTLLPPTLRYHPDLPYMVAGDGSGGWVQVHRGPAMVAAVQDARGRFTAVHRTWIDLSRPKGTAAIVHAGERLAAKKSWGPVKGASIRLSPQRDCDVLVMGEGIETTLTARIADAFPSAAYWAGISLGNMAGRRVLRGAGMKFAGVPDLSDSNAFVPPDWVRWLVFIMDGDSEPRATRAHLLAGLRRAKARSPGLERISIVPCPVGCDLNDVLRSGGGMPDPEDGCEE